ncbi:MCE family protein [Nocardioides ferulae]|uniref:MCE family protein n=1 Tax=Nocardioides ferulae TaxID=2340821 RepID=UPI000EB4B900|nr:MCE family protein [Nocardioides ferulae]
MTGPAYPRLRPRLLTPLAAALAAVVLGTSACSPELRDVPMPGLVSGPTRSVDAVFDSALNLPLDAPVKLDGSTVGQVSAIEVRDYRAHVTMDLLESVPLHEGARADIRLTSPMGNAFVELTDGTGAVLPAGSALPVGATGQAPDVSDLLSALSVVVTGGSFADVKTIVEELNTALTGRTRRVRSLLGRLDRTLTSFAAQTERFDRTLAGIDRLGRRLAADTPFLTEAVAEVRPTVRALTRQQDDALALLAEVRRFGDVGTEVLTRTRGDLVRSLRELEPVLDSLLRTRGRMVPIMRGILEFGSRTDAASPGDYSNFDLVFDVDPSALVPQAGGSAGGAGGAGGGGDGRGGPDAGDDDRTGGDSSDDYGLAALLSLLGGLG